MTRLAAVLLAMAMIGAVALGPAEAEGAPGGPATEFGDDGVARLADLIEEPTAVETDRRGRIYLFGYLDSGGRCESQGGDTVVRLRPDGTVDRGYGRAGVARLPPGSFGGVAVAVDRFGRALVLAVVRPGEKRRLNVLRVDATGRLDRSFGRGGTVRLGQRHDRVGLGQAIEINRDGDIYVFASRNKRTFGDRMVSAAVASAIRLRPNGRVDLSFGTRGRFVRRFPAAQNVQAVAEQSSRGVVFYGTTCCRHRRVPVAYRLRADGRLDGRFGRWVGRRWLGRDLRLEVAGAVARRAGPVELYGRFRNGDSRRGFFLRLRRDGRLTHRYGTNRGATYLGWPIRSAAGPDRRGRVVAYSANTLIVSPPQVQRMTMAGRLDPSFGDSDGSVVLRDFGILNDPLSVVESRGRPILFVGNPRWCPFRGRGDCTPANPLLIAFEG